MAPTVYGPDVATRINVQQTNEQTGAVTTTEVWRGTAAAATAKYLEFQALYGADNVQIVLDKGAGNVTLESADDISPGSIQDNWTWELAGSSLEKPLESFYGIWNAGKPPVRDANKQRFDLNADQVAIGQVLQEHEKGNLLYVPAGEPALTFAKIHRRGTTGYLRSALTLRASKRVSKRAAILHISWRGVDRAHATMDQNGGPYNMPADMLASLEEFPEFDVSAKQWLKQAPTQRTSDGKLYDISFTWLWARRWSFTLYDGDNEDGNP